MKFKFCVWNVDRAMPAPGVFQLARQAYAEAARLEAAARDHFAVIRVPA